MKTSKRKKNINLKNKIRSNELTIGSWISFGFTPTCEIMCRAGFDWLVIDMEHTSITNSECLNLIQIIENNQVSPIVRVGDKSPLQIKRAMDAGSHGIIVPMINTLDDAKEAINSLYYPPKGNRGVGLARAQGYGLNFEEYKNWCKNNTLFVPQIEHIKAVENLDKILQLDEVDAFIVGPYDLSGSLGVPGQWDHPYFIDAMKKINNSMLRSKKPGGYHLVHTDEFKLKKLISEGYKFIGYGDDMVIFAEAIENEKSIISKLDY